MGLEIIINGAAGRMGSTLVRLTMEDQELELVGAVERPGNEDALKGLSCTVGTDLGHVLDAHPKAVVVDFTAPESSVALSRVVADKGAKAVIGTTGLDAAQQEALAESASRAAIFWAPNMSVGINVLLKVLPDLVGKLGSDYDLEIMEIHHNKKADAPSGTAIKLGQCVAEARNWSLEDKGLYCRQGIIGARPREEIGVQTLRGGDVVGEHTIYFFGPGERVEVTHKAHSRETFTQGALRAAKWLADQKPGRLYSMSDMF
jgi:4-hydroxy-tetrahydrodipicolinate reductase